MSHQTNFKQPRIVDKVRNHIRRQKTVSDEQKVMRAVRREDRYCRFPLCGCGKLKLTLDVAHAGADGHRGMGGNPSLSRTTPGNLILVCRPRHKAHQFAVDKKTLKVEALTDRGLRGPVRWLIDPHVFELLPTWVKVDWSLLWSTLVVIRDGREWWEIARETSPHHYEPFTEAQRAVLTLLAEMGC